MEATVRPRLTAVAIAIAVSLGIAATRAYFVEPKTSANGWTPRWGHVGQSFVANVDSIYYLEWFVGELSQPGLYEFEITQNGQFVCGGEESVPARGWKWLRCDNFTGDLQFTKGKDYVLKVSHSGGDSVNFVYRTDNPYQYGVISVGGGQPQPPPQTSHDLVARVVGRMNPVSDVWRACVNFGNEPNVDTALARADTIGIEWLRDDFENMKTWEDDTVPAMNIYRRYEDRYDVLGILCYGSDDSLRKSSRGSKLGSTDLFPPRNLYDDVHCDTNWWAGYCETIMGMRKRGTLPNFQSEARQGHCADTVDDGCLIHI